MTTTMELISIVDCDLCVTLPPEQKVWDLPLPETWGRLSTILVKGGWEGREAWSTDPARYTSALDIEEVRVCRSCRTHYYYHQAHDPHFGEPQDSETDWHLRRLTPADARDYYLDHTDHNGVVEHRDGGWLDRQYETIIGLLRRDLPRAPDWQIKRYMVDSLYAHYIGNQDWEGLRATLIDFPDPAVGVYVAARIFWAIDPENPGRRMASTTTYWDNVSAIVGVEPTREPLLVAVLAGGLSAQGQSLGFSDREEPVAVSGMSRHTLLNCVPPESLAPAIPALAAELQRLGSASMWLRERVRDFLIGYVGDAPERAKEMLEALAGDTDEELAVRTHCQRCLAQSAC
jgi:hypothetical protein